MDEEQLNETEEMLAALPVEPTRFDLLRGFVETCFDETDATFSASVNPERTKVTLWFCDGGCLIFPVSAAQGDIAPFCS